MNSEQTSTDTKEKQGRLLKQEIHEIKTTTQDMKEVLNKDMENLRKKNPTESLEIKSPFNQIKKYSGRPLQQTRTSGRQNLRV
jgi:hypothetical protein